MANWAEILVGMLLFFFGTGLALPTIIGIPAGVTADIIGIILMVHGATGGKRLR